MYLSLDVYQRKEYRNCHYKPLAASMGLEVNNSMHNNALM